MNINTDNGPAYKYTKNSGLNKLLKILFKREKENFNITQNIEEDNQELLRNVNDAKKEWNEANTRFEYADSKELVDYYTYKIKACQVRYDYFLKRAKEKGIKVNSEV